MVFDKSVKVLNTVEEASSDLSCHFAVDILNREEDSVSDELGLFSSVVELVEFVKVNLRESNLSSLGIGLGLLGSHHVVGWEVVLVHDRLVVTTLVSLTLVTTTSLVLVATSTTSVVVETSVVVPTVLVLVIETSLEHLLVGLVVGSDDPFFLV